MAVDGKIVQEFQDALLSAFSAAELTRLVRIELGENIEEIAIGANQTQVVFELITWADRRGRLADLVAAAQRSNPDNAALQRFMEQHGHAIVASTAEPNAPTDPTRLHYPDLR